MNSSLLVPAFVGLSLAAVFGVFFGESLFSGDSQTDTERRIAKVETVKAKTAPKTEAVSATTDSDSNAGSDFSWDFSSDSKSDAPAATPAVTKKTEVVKTGDFEVAPGDLLDAAKEKSSAVKTSVTESDVQIGSDLDGFFNRKSPKTSPVDVSKQQEAVDLAVAKPAKAPRNDFSMAPGEFGSSASSSKTKDSLDSKVAVAKPKSGFGDNFDLDSFGGPSLNDSNQANKKPNGFATPKTDAAPKSVVVSAPLKSVPQTPKSQTSKGSSSVIAGDFEPTPQAGPSSKASMMPRKLKITNPKETTLPVTLSIDGEQITLKPDQSYVCTNQEVEVKFSRGGSFGFKTQKLTEGHYRFSVSRESGWKLSN